MQNNTTPLNTCAADLISDLDGDLREEFEERAAIIEYDGQFPRPHAESLALIDVLLRHPYALIGVSVLQIEIEGKTSWWLTTDLPLARQHLAYVGGLEKGARKLSEVIDEQYSGIAILAALG